MHPAVLDEEERSTKRVFKDFLMIQLNGARKALIITCERRREKITFRQQFRAKEIIKV
jgi:hypothetical protein